MADDLFAAAAEERLSGRSPLAARLRRATSTMWSASATCLPPGVRCGL